MKKAVAHVPPVHRAEAVKLDSLSVHSDAAEIISWLHGFKTAPRQTFISHGDPADARRQCTERELHRSCHRPNYIESVMPDWAGTQRRIHAITAFNCIRLARTLSGRLAVFRGPHYQHRHRRVPHDLLGITAQQYATDAAPPMGAYNDQIRL